MDKKAFITELVKLADHLDQKGLQEEANELDKIVQEAQGYIWPTTPAGPERRERGTHLPTWRKLQMEREKRYPEEEKKPDTGEATVAPTV